MGADTSHRWLPLFAAIPVNVSRSTRSDVGFPSPLTPPEKFATVSQLRLRRSVMRRSTRPERRDIRLLIGDEPIVDVLMVRKKKPRKKQAPRGGALPLAKTKLTDAVVALIHKRLKTVVGDDGKVRSVWIASRYDELCEAIEAARGGSGGKWSHQLPFWADAFVLRDDVDAEIAKMHPSPDGWSGWTRHRLEALEQHKWRPQDCDTMKRHTETLDNFAKRIDQLFAPRPISLPDPCPECGHKIVYRDLDGEKVRTLALQVTENGATCGNCHANWPIEHLELLGKILAQQRMVSDDDDSERAESCG